MLHLRELVKQGPQTQRMVINKRLPAFLSAPCDIMLTYQVKAQEDYYLLDLEVSGSLDVICQRCLKSFKLEYANSTTIAICENEERASHLLEQYETIDASNSQVNLEDLIIDELHLYVPQFHPTTQECDESVTLFITKKSEKS